MATVLDSARRRIAAALLLAGIGGSLAAPHALGADRAGEAPAPGAVQSAVTVQNAGTVADGAGRGTVPGSQTERVRQEFGSLGIALSAIALLSLAPVAFNRALRRRLRAQDEALQAAAAAQREAERRADENRDQLSATLNAIPDLMFQVDREGRYLSVHASRVEHLAAPEDALLGRTVSEVLPPEAAAVCMQALAEAHATGYSYGRQFSLPLPGRSAWFELSIARKDSGAADDPHFVVLSRDITDRRLAETSLTRLNLLHAAMSECSQAIVRCATEAELMREVCHAAVSYGGMRMAWIGLLDADGRTVRPVAQHGDGPEYVAGIRIVCDETDPFGRGPTGTAIRENRAVWCQDYANDPSTAPWHDRGREFGWAASASLPLHRSGRVVGAMALYASEPDAFDEAARKLLGEMAMNMDFALDRFHNDSERTRMALAIAASEAKYRELTESINDVIWTFDVVSERFLYVSAAVLRLRGFTPAEVMEQTFEEVVGEEDADMLRAVLAVEVAEFEAGRRTSSDFTVKEVRQLRKDGSAVWTEAVMNIVRDPRTGRLEVHGTTRDMTERKSAEAQIQQLAHFDHLTGLPNRVLLKDRFDYALSLERRNGERLAVMFLDLDHFKDINDTLGHDTGDRLLVEIAQRLTGALRETDTVSRLGGDEFIVLLPSTDAPGVASVAAELLEVIARPFRDGTHELRTTGSIGIAVYPDDGSTSEVLSRSADAAMYQAKRDGRNSFRFFTPEIQTRSARTLAMAAALHEALPRNQFSIKYQPQVSLTDGRIIGAEALLRWQHPEFGAVAPSEFIPIIERNGLIPQIGEWVLRQAANQARQWLDQGLPALTIAVNLSPIQFRNPDLTRQVARIVDDAGLPSGMLELELTEAATMQDSLNAAEIIDRLHAHGVRMSIDDFGTGYSSLSYLKRFKVAKLKIDQSFVRDISDDPEDRAIVTAIIMLAHSLGLRTVAEGVETSEQLEFLRTHGCDEAQGYYFSRPLGPEEFAAFVRVRRTA